MGFGKFLSFGPGSLGVMDYKEVPDCVKIGLGVVGDFGAWETYDVPVTFRISGDLTAYREARKIKPARYVLPPRTRVSIMWIKANAIYVTGDVDWGESDGFA